MSPRNHSVTVVESQYHVVDSTNPRGALDDGVEHRLHVRRRAADDAEHLGRRRLMLQRLAQFSVALLEFLEQPHILDRDDCLVGESLEKGDLLIRERTNLRSTNMNHPNGISLSQQWCSEYRMNTKAPSVRVETSLSGSHCHIMHMHCFSVQGRPCPLDQPRSIITASTMASGTGTEPYLATALHLVAFYSINLGIN